MNKETKNLEYKETVTKTYLKTVSAFANFGDGEIRFGVTDEGEIKPIKDYKYFSINLENQINDFISPHPDYLICPNNDGTVSLFIKKGKNTPYVYNHRAYKRNDMVTIEVDDIEMKRLILEGTNLTFDEIPVLNTNLNFNSLKEYLLKAIGLDKFDIDTLKNLKLYANDSYNNAACLLADENNMPGLDIVIFGDDINQIKERITLNHISLIEQFYKAIEIYERTYVYEQVNGFLRERTEIISKSAFREAIANAIVHRTYDILANTKVSMFKDKIEISSPGGLMYGMSKDQFLRGAFSLLRNPILANVFNRLKIIEAFATGIQRINDSYDKYDLKPTFYVDDYQVAITLPSLKKENINQNQEQLIELLNKNCLYSREEIENITGYSKDKIIRILNELVKRGVISKVGVGRNTKYYIK